MQPKIETAGMARRAMLEKMEESGLDIRDLKQLGFEAFTAKELAARYPKLTEHLGAGFILPYFDPEGAETGFFRYRYLERPQIHGFKALTLRDKKFKYIQPSKVPPRLYFSPFINWMEYLSKPAEDRPLIITEGELKAACATKMGLAVLGLGGVWNFRGGTKELVISDLKRLPLKDIRIYIVFDSDTITNAQVIIAENALAKELLNLGAEVFVVRLPSIFPEKEKKTGLDDFLVARGANDFIELMAETAPWDRSRALHELNEEVVLVRNPGLIVKLENMQRMSLMQFQSVVYANRTIEIAAADKNGKVKLTRKPLAPEWVHWPHRAEVERVTYAPGEPPICPPDPDKDRKDYELNTWPGWGLDPELVVKGDIKLWTELIDFIFSGDRARASDRKWFEQWLAYPIQNPGTKMYSAVVVWGRLHGSGKSLLGYTMERIYGRNFAEIADKDLLGNFNEWAENKQFVLGDEITGGDKRASGDRMKGMITQKNLRMNAKFIPSYIVPDCINYYFTSNHPDSFFLEDTDRRYFIHEVTGKPLSEEFYRRYDAWYKSNAVGALQYHLLSLDMTGFNPLAHAPVTNSKLDMIDIGRSELAAWVNSFWDDPSNVGAPAAYTLMTKGELFSVFCTNTNQNGSGRVTQQGLLKAMRARGFVTVGQGAKIKTHFGMNQLWAVRNRDELAKVTDLEKLAAVYNSEHPTASQFVKGVGA